MALVRAHPPLGRGESPVRGAEGVAVVAVPIAAGDGGVERATPSRAMAPGKRRLTSASTWRPWRRSTGSPARPATCWPFPAPPNSEGLPSRLVLIGLGNGSPAELRKAGAALARATMGTESVRTTAADSLPEELQQAFIEGFLLGGYRPRVPVPRQRRSQWPRCWKSAAWRRGRPRLPPPVPGPRGWPGTWRTCRPT